MAKLLEKVLDFVGWETDAYMEDDIYEDEIIESPPHKAERIPSYKKNQQGKVLNMNNNNLKVVVLSPSEYT